MVEVLDRRMIEEIKVSVKIQLVNGEPQDDLSRAIFDKLPPKEEEKAPNPNVMVRR